MAQNNGSYIGKAVALVFSGVVAPVLVQVLSHRIDGLTHQAADVKYATPAPAVSVERQVIAPVPIANRAAQPAFDADSIRSDLGASSNGPGTAPRQGLRLSVRVGPAQ